MTDAQEWYGKRKEYYVYDPALEIESEASKFNVYEYEGTPEHMTAAKIFAEDHCSCNNGPGSLRWFNGVNLRVRREGESEWKIIRVEAETDITFYAKEVV